MKTTIKKHSNPAEEKRRKDLKAAKKRVNKGVIVWPSGNKGTYIRAKHGNLK